jgi:nicotinamidase-related amidase
MELPRDDPWVSRGYGQEAIEPGERPAVLVVDFQYAFTDPAFPMGGAPLVERAVENAAPLLHAAREAGVPVYQGRDGHESNLRDVHRRYAQVTTADEAVGYLRHVRVFA